MKFNPESVRPSDSGAERNFIPNAEPLGEETTFAPVPDKAETPRTLTERVVRFLDIRAA
jgi:hypothetical protein